MFSPLDFACRVYKCNENARPGPKTCFEHPSAGPPSPAPARSFFCTARALSLLRPGSEDHSGLPPPPTPHTHTHICTRTQTTTPNTTHTTRARTRTNAHAHTKTHKRTHACAMGAVDTTERSRAVMWYDVRAPQFGGLRKRGKQPCLRHSPQTTAGAASSCAASTSASASAFFFCAPPACRSLSQMPLATRHTLSTRSQRRGHGHTIAETRARLCDGLTDTSRTKSRRR